VPFTVSHNFEVKTNNWRSSTAPQTYELIRETPSWIEATHSSCVAIYLFHQVLHLHWIRISHYQRVMLRPAAGSRQSLTMCRKEHRVCCTHRGSQKAQIPSQLSSAMQQCNMPLIWPLTRRSGILGRARGCADNTKSCTRRLKQASEQSEQNRYASENKDLATCLQVRD
jgi:hypothetical protein